MQGTLAGFDPIESAPAVIAVIVGLLVWRRHQADRRAKLFLALAGSELAFAVPMAIALFVPQTPFVMAVLDGLLIGTGLLSTIVFLHFGLAFPHARPWLRRGWMSSLYVAALIAGLIPIAVQLAGFGAGAAVQDVFDSVVILAGPLLVVGLITACFAIYRSYREMTADERLRFRVPVLGVLVAMIAGVLISLVLGLMFGLLLEGDNRYAVWTANTLATAAELLLPLFFFMAAVKYQLLDHHSQDFAVPSQTGARQ